VDVPPDRAAEARRDVGELHPVTLRFVDPALEREYQVELGARNRVHVGVGAVVSAALWGVVALLIRAVLPDPAPALYVVAAAMGAANLAVLAATPWADTLDRQLWLGTALNTLAGFAVLWMAQLEGSLRHLVAPALLLMAMFAFMVMRLRFLSATVAVGSYVATFALVSVLAGGRALDVFLVTTAVGICASAAYFLETSTRTVFHQTRVITAQQAAIAREKEKSDRLLLNVLPEPIALRLREDTASLAEAFGDATVLFADLVGFTPLAGRLPAERVVRLLDELFSRFDDLAERHGVEKIKTIGDAYMAVAGVPTRCEDHAERVVAMGREMLGVVAERSSREGLDLALRIGIHSGPVIAGVLGKKRLVYDLWGDTVNVASRMESHGVPGRLQLTADTLARLRGVADAVERAPIQVKGKGEMRTFLLGPLTR
jgi:class 3 adenylate cyclase